MKQVIAILVVVVIGIMSMTASGAGNENTNAEVFLGKVPVYKFKMDSLHFSDNTNRMCAIGTEYMAELYSLAIGGEIFFKIMINGEAYSVVANQYGSRVSPENYYQHFLLKEGNYNTAPKLSHMAGPYFLNLPYSSKPNEKVASEDTKKSTSSTSQSAAETKKQQVEWQLMGKVDAVYDIRKTRSGGEDDLIYDKETAFLYSAFDGEQMKYKISIPKYNVQYDVYESGSYDGSRVQWDHHGKHVWSIPSLGQMYTHRAGKYYFNVESVRP